MKIWDDGQVGALESLYINVLGCNRLEIGRLENRRRRP